MTPCLAAVYEAPLAVPTSPATDAVFTIVPLLLGTITANSCFMHSHTPPKLTAMTRSQTSRARSSNGVIAGATPALLNAASSPP